MIEVIQYYHWVKYYFCLYIHIGTDNDLSIGEIVGILISVLFIFIIILVSIIVTVAIYIKCKKSARRNNNNDTTSSNDSQTKLAERSVKTGGKAPCAIC